MYSDDVPIMQKTNHLRTRKFPVCVTMAYVCFSFVVHAAKSRVRQIQGKSFKAYVAAERNYVLRAR